MRENVATGPIRRKPAPTKRNSDKRDLKPAEPPQVAPLPPLPKVDRIYQPETSALDDLVDVLQSLLLDGPDCRFSPKCRSKTSQLAFRPRPSEECV